MAHPKVVLYLGHINGAKLGHIDGAKLGHITNKSIN